FSFYLALQLFYLEMRTALIFFSVLSGVILFGQTPETLVQLGHSDRVTCVDISTDARYAVTGSMDHTVKLWNISNGQVIRTFRKHNGMIYDLRLAKDNKSIFSCSWDDKLLLKCDVLSGKILKQFKDARDPINSMDLSHEGKFLACTNEKGIQVFN